MSEEIGQYGGGALTASAVPVRDIKAQVNLIQRVMKDVMIPGEHYGKIPGCGDKPTLRKSGAEKIMMTFRLSNDAVIEKTELPNGHREYMVTVTLYSPAGQRLGTGVGSCSTMEGKYRFRAADGETTGIVIPKSYWEVKKERPADAQALLKELAGKAGLGGDRYGARKNDAGQWVITVSGGRVEHDNPADHYNTALKMAKKRALVDAVLTTTAASDIFTQDVEDMAEARPTAPGEPAAKDAEAGAGMERMAEIDRLKAVKDIPGDRLAKLEALIKAGMTEPVADRVIGELRSLPDNRKTEEK